MPTRREVLSAACALGATTMLSRFVQAQAGTTARKAASPGANPAEDFLSYVNPEFRAGAGQMSKMFGNMPPLSAQPCPA